MKRKIFSILFALVLVLSLGLVTAAPVAASPAILEVNGPPVQLATGALNLGSFSPDGSKIVYGGVGAIGVMNADGSNPQVIYPSGSRPNWGPPIVGYPDGLIALAGTGITIIQPDGTLVKTIVTDHVYPGDGLIKTGTHSLDWSLDGSKIAFADNAGTMGIWVIGFDGTGLSQITDYSKTAYSPTWSPDGTEIACAWGPNTGMYVGVFASDGTGLHREIGIGGSYGGDYPDWGANDKIAYHDDTKALHVMNRNGGEDTVVFAGPAAMVAWSPDGQTLAYVDATSGLFGNVWTRGYPCATIQAAINAATEGDTILVGAGEYVLTSTVAINKANLIVQGESNTSTVIKTSGSGHAFNISAAGVTLKDLQIEKTDLTNQDIILITGNDVTIQDNVIFGPAPDPDYNHGSGIVTRALEISGGLTGLMIKGNTMHTLRQPAYINPNTVGTIEDNFVYGTKGWVVDGANLAFINNTWGDGVTTQANWWDVALLEGAPPTDHGVYDALYPDLIALSAANNGATIEDQRPTPRLRNVVYVQEGGTGDGSVHGPLGAISDGVAGVVSGGTVNVAAGLYPENVDVDRQVTIIGAGAANTVVTAAEDTDHVFEVTANGVSISGFTVQGVDEFADETAGIYLGGVENCNISNNTATDNAYGIFLEDSDGNTIIGNTCSENFHSGIHLKGSSGNFIIEGNTCNSSLKGCGIYLEEWSDENTITGNTCNSNAQSGIYLSKSSYNPITGNFCNSNGDYGMHLTGMGPGAESSHNTITGNTCNSNQGGFFGNGAGIVLFSAAPGNTIEGNTCNSNTQYGVWVRFYDNDNNIFRGNTLNLNAIGIEISSSSNTLEGNTIESNTDTGIKNSGSATGNTIEDNQLQENPIQVLDAAGSLDIQGVLGTNDFDRAVVVNRPTTSFLHTIWSSIQDAIDVAEPNDTVIVVPGTYDESVTIGTNNLTIAGDQTTRPAITGGLKLDTGLTGLNLVNLYVTGDAGSNSVVRMFGAITDLAIHNCVFDGENVADRCGFTGGQLEGNVSITGSDFKNILGWAVLDSRSGSGGDGSAMGTVTFTGNDIYDCNGSIVFRGLSTDRTDLVDVYGNTFDNIGGNEGQVGEHWAALEVNRAVAVNVYGNTVNDVAEGEWGEGQAFQFWDIDELYVCGNDIRNCFEGIFIYGDLGSTLGGPFAIPGGYICANNIVGNTEYGIKVDEAATGGPLDATYNWWGSVNGPGQDEANGVLGDVDYSPWLPGEWEDYLDPETEDFIDSDGDGFSDLEEYWLGTNPNDINDFPGATINLDEVDNAYVEGDDPGEVNLQDSEGGTIADVDISGGGDVSGTITGARYTEDPGDTSLSVGTGTTGVVFLDVKVTGYTEGIAHITVPYPDVAPDDGIVDGTTIVETTLSLYYWDDATSMWLIADNNEVDTVNNNVSGDIPISALTGTPIGGGGYEIDEATVAIESILNLNFSVEGGTVTLTIDTNTAFLGAATIDLIFDPRVVEVVAAENGAFDILTVNTSYAVIGNDTQIARFVVYQDQEAGEGVDATGGVVVAVVKLNAVGSTMDESPLSLEVITLKDNKGDNIPFTLEANDSIAIVGGIGDADRNGVVDVFDCVYSARAIAGFPGWSIDTPTMDVSGDDMVDAWDCTYLSWHLAGDPDYPLGG